MRKLFISSFIRIFSMGSFAPDLRDKSYDSEQDMLQVMRDMNKSYLKISKENEHN